MKILVVAPHPDDETLGCCGTLLKHKEEGGSIYWLIITGLSSDHGWDKETIKKRDIEIGKVSKKYGFLETYNLGFPTTKIEQTNTSDLINKISKIYKKVKPNIVYMPFAYDVHTDHQIIAKALQSTIKWFRYSHIKKVYMYETISETEFNFVETRIFRANVFVNISKYINDKIEIMKIYRGEISEHPFPRSEQKIRSLAILRGSQSGFEFAEAFELVYERKQ